MSDFYRIASSHLLPAPPADAFLQNGRPPQGDHLSPEEWAKVGARPAAVLVPVVSHAGGATILLTKRAAHLRSHSGQIAFPGGRIDAGDDGPLAAALREAHEETGLQASQIETLGYLDAYQTGTGYRIVPVVARVYPPLLLQPNADEVEAAFEVPLDFLMDPANHRIETRQWQGRERRFYAMTFHNHYIWGATAGILRNLYERLYL
ncbi:MAG: CoA pyrophosphatase [Hyphomicrobiales bacterium]|nr:CoA pyrophosphatase [Hyphomicrobiales bacterium]MDE2114957.1 CoA pyrophosphatase [Hyphomicrobiales bacterium]